MYYDGPFKTWADDLASNKPAPGGGSAAALVGVSGCALLSMVSNFTIGKKKFKDVEAEIQGLLGRVEEARAGLAKLIDDDVAQYSKVTAAYGMPKSNDEEKAARKAAIQEALKAAMSVPLEACRLAHKALMLAPPLLEKGNPNLVSDVGVGAQCLASAYRSAWLNVEINLSFLKDKDFVAGIRQELEPLSGEVESLLKSVWEGTVKKVKGE
ncbi:MAG: cyclodeaminase/cyclohydrolase family protein [Planctomycetota bacterium]|jgi:formiminotetrahydrofolate cyclodeaminase